ncbi:hypothetical protein [Metabacillus litoralis]|uniref:hypothetical protein n=1 Tax=Metabacillus litoralis TaxID=152268 RepID=UPI00203F6AE0|nr:hypothetical protein [Metabacillus litoralis]MCM3162237.1 hypothetical protein [Metabacillus litoralis]
MFTKLRNQFLVVNMVTIFVIMLVAFSLIYMIMCQKVNSDINTELQRVYSFYDKPHPPPLTEGDETPKENLSLCFEIETDSHFHFNREFYDL